MKKLFCTTLILLLLAFPLWPEVKITDLSRQLTQEKVFVEKYLDESHGPKLILGYSHQSFINPNFYFAAEINGIIAGVQGGFGLVGAGFGYQSPIYPDLDAYVQALLGSGGGGGIAGGGGLMYKVTAGFDYKFYKNLSFDWHFGYLDFIAGSLKTWVLACGVKWEFWTIGLT